MNNGQVQSSYSLDHLKDLLDNAKYNVVMFDDDVTPVEYVVQILAIIFGYPNEKIPDKIMEIQEKGSAVVLSCSMDKAYKTVELVEKQNKNLGFFLQVTIEI